MTRRRSCPSSTAWPSGTYPSLSSTSTATGCGHSTGATSSGTRRLSRTRRVCSSACTNAASRSACGSTRTLPSAPTCSGRGRNSVTSCARQTGQCGNGISGRPEWLWSTSPIPTLSSGIRTSCAHCSGRELTPSRPTSASASPRTSSGMTARTRSACTTTTPSSTTRPCSSSSRRSSASVKRSCSRGPRLPAARSSPCTGAEIASPPSLPCRSPSAAVCRSPRRASPSGATTSEGSKAHRNRRCSSGGSPSGCCHPTRGCTAQTPTGSRGWSMKSPWTYCATSPN